MKVIYTHQSIKSLEESISFLLQQQDHTPEKAALLKDQLFDSADSLALNPEKGQQEEYLLHLKEGHRRIIRGNFKIIYKIYKSNIYIIDFFDTRQSPEKMRG